MEMPEFMRPQYQYFTEAKMEKLRAAGYKKPFMELEDAVRDYVGYLKNHTYL
jgi:ADP-L-glycero-D-manno-heptose 6-epimerase